MDLVIVLLIAHFNHHRKHLDDATITLIDQLLESDEQPDGSQKDALYEAEWKLKGDLGYQEYFRRTRSQFRTLPPVSQSCGRYLLPS